MKKNTLVYLFLFFGSLAALLQAFFSIQRDSPVLVGSLLAVNILCFLVLWLRYRRLLKFLRDVSSALIRVSNQDFPKNLIPTSHSEFIPVTRALQKVAVNMNRQISDLISERNQLKTVLDGMVEGVLVTDARGGIILLNSAVEAMLDLKGICTGKTILEVSRNSDLHETVKAVQQGERPVEKDISVYFNQATRYLSVYTAPVLLSPGNLGAVSVFADVTELRRLENVRKEFVANVSHELKTPLTSILGYTETLRAGALSDQPTAERFLEKIESNSKHLKNLVEDILKISEIESGRFYLRPEPIPLRKFLAEILAQTREAAARKNIKVEETIPENLPILHSDVKSLRQILCNLLDNAVKYTPEQGHVRLSVTLEGQAVVFRVEDDGMGIREADLERIFERFYRVDAARSRAEGGTGLGLSIVKHLTSELGGEVEAKSEVGKGSHFTLRLPLVEADTKKTNAL